MTGLRDIIAWGKRVNRHHPWPRVAVSEGEWQTAIGALVSGEAALFGLWGEPTAVHMALLLAEGPARIAILSLDCPLGRYPAVSADHPPAIRPERAIRDLFGLEALAAEDVRPWLDHGRWPAPRPLADGTIRAIRAQAAEKAGKRPAASAYPFLPVEGEGLHQVPVGPVHAGIIEPGHFRFTANGETVVRLEERLGYVHKGIQGLFRGAPLAAAARLAGRQSGDSTVAYGLAFARAVEAALGLEVPERAVGLRALMAELERLANHLGDIGAICNDAAFALMLAHCAVLREKVLRFCGDAFGHRLMMDRIVPGGVAADLDAEHKTGLAQLVVEIREILPRLVNLYDQTASLQDRTVGTGVLSVELARRFAAGGYVGRASGRDFDARRDLAYPPYDRLDFTVPVLADGDVNARVWIRIREVEQSLGLIMQLLDLPFGPLAARLPEKRAGEGLAVVEGFRGDVLASVRLDDRGHVEQCFLRDPSWFQWPLVEAVIEGNIVADFPLCNKSFNCSYSGHDG